MSASPRLFNRLAGRALAIVDDRPGVTRDRREGTGRLGDLDLELIDTAGFENFTDESLQARMQIQAERAIADSDLSLLVIDAREGITPLDQIFAELLRRTGKPLVLVANKAEGRSGDAGATDAFSLGMGEPVAISAEHGEGMSDLYDAMLAAVRQGERGQTWPRRWTTRTGRSASPSSAGRTPASRPWSTS